VSSPLAQLSRAFHARAVRFVLIGVGGANFHALSGSTVFTTEDRDLFLPLDTDNLVRCWEACEALNLALWSPDEPRDMPRDRWLAERVIERRTLTRATAPDVQFDLSLVMAGFDFEEVWDGRRIFKLDDVDVPVARLLHIIRSKHATGRDKDKLFLATHRAALEELLRREDHD
jgi:hypothetical protein